MRHKRYRPAVEEASMASIVCLGGNTGYLTVDIPRKEKTNIPKVQGELGAVADPERGLNRVLFFFNPGERATEPALVCMNT